MINKLSLPLITFIISNATIIGYPQIAFANHCKTISDSCSWLSEKSYVDKFKCVRKDGLPDHWFTLQKSMEVGIFVKAESSDANPMFYIEGITNDSNCGAVLVENDSHNQTERDYFYLGQGKYYIFVGNSGWESNYTIHIYTCDRYWEHDFKCWDDLSLD